MRRILFLLILICFLSSCSSSLKLNNSLIKRLRNRGPVALSSDNPFIAANLLISNEAQNSPELAGFINHRGAPLAIEIHTELFEPVNMDFFYPKEQEVYSLEDYENTWIIRGPFPLDRDKMKEVLALTAGIKEDPKLSIAKAPVATNVESPYSKSEVLETKPKVEEVEPESSDIKKPAPESEKITAFQSPYTSNVARSAAVSASQEEETIAKLSQAIRETPELTPKGDAVHYVTYSGETLSMIARWYTNERANASKLARINKLNNPNKLDIGDTVIIPSYLLKNKKRLTEQAVQALTILASKS